MSLGTVDVGRSDLPNHAADIGLGGLNANAVFHDGAINASTGFNFEGHIGEFGLFNGALTQEEILALGDTNPNIFDALNEPSVDVVVQTTDPSGETYSETVSIGIAGQNLVVNGGFEDTGQAANSFSLLPEEVVPGWSTTDISNTIEVWGEDFIVNNSPDGGARVEAGSFFNNTTLSQTIDVVAGEEYDWSFYHRGRHGEDTLRLDIADASNPAASDALGSFTTGNADWEQYSGTYTVPDGVTSISLNFTIVSNIGATGQGNLLDGVHFGLAAPSAAQASPLKASYAQTSGSDFAALLADGKEEAVAGADPTTDQSQPFSLDQDFDDDQNGANEQTLDVV